MPNRIDHLTLLFSYPERGEETPHIALQDATGHAFACISTRQPIPDMPLQDDSVRTVTAFDVLEHVHDEQAWLAELARVLVPGGELNVRVPLENWMAWADAINISRYVADVTGMGAEPFETIPTGWHRHYHPDDLPALVELAGFEIASVTTQGTPVLEVPHLAALLLGNVIGNHQLQRRVSTWLERVRQGIRLPLPAKVASTITVRARNVREGFDPGATIDAELHPVTDGDNPLE